MSDEQSTVQRGDSVPPPPGGRQPIWALVAFGAALVAALGWAAWDLGGDQDSEPELELPELPTPREPRAIPMVSTGTGFGWTWVNPIPRAMPTWYAADAQGGGDPVVLVGRSGRAVRYEGGALFDWRTNTRADLRGVAWTGAREALAAGAGGALIRLTEDAPRALDAGTDATLRDVVAVSPEEALVVGDQGIVLRVRGDAVSALEAPTDADLLAAFARGDDAFVVGGDGTVLHLRDGAFTVERSGVNVTLRAVGGCPSGLVYAAGDEGMLLWRKRDGVWDPVRVNGTEAFTGVSCDHGRVAAVRRDGSVLLVSGERTLALPSGFDGVWHAVAGGTSGPSWLAGAGGRLATIEEDYVRTRTAGPTVPIRDLGSMGGALVAVGEWGRILRERERGFAQVSSPTDSGLAALIQLDEGRLLAVGDFGAMVEITFDGAQLVATPTRSSLRDGVAADDELLVVGAEGQLLRGAVGQLESSVIADVGDLWSVAGSPRDAVAVGDAGVVLRIRGERVQRLPCEGPTLRAVIRVPEGTWAVGDDGIIVRVGEAGCTEERRGGPALHAIGVGPEGRLLAGGDEGVVLVRGEERAQWSEEDVDVGDATVRAIWRGARQVYLAGTGGVLVRHIRVDGE